MRSPILDPERVYAALFTQHMALLVLPQPICCTTAGLAVHQVQGLQLHGTGTSLGDPIEVGAAAGALGGPCLLAWLFWPCCEPIFLPYCKIMQWCLSLSCQHCAGLLLEGRAAPLPLLASKSGLGHSEPASGIMGLARLHQVGCDWWTITLQPSQKLTQAVLSGALRSSML